MGVPPAAERATGGRRLVVGIGELAVSDSPGDVIVTHALGSCIAVCLWDPASQVGGLLHFLLPDSRINGARAAAQPATFADLGIPRLLEAVTARGWRKTRAQVRLIGGAEAVGRAGGGTGTLNIGKRNIVAARGLLWRAGIMVTGEDVGGSQARTVSLAMADGRVRVTSGGAVVNEL
ncbi:MAG: chemotaxis protein CheD [Acidobacteriota bacterium]|nr:chemotaxis protein CheD [Acidobacteriota bacterium]